MLQTFRFFMLPIVVFLSVSIWKNSAPFFVPRFWDEEATRYLNGIQGQDWVYALSFITNSNLQLITNTFVKLSSYFPLKYAPFITTYLSVIFSLLLPTVLGKFGKDKGVSPLIIVTASAYVAIAPMTFEIFATATNVQWYSGAILFILLFCNLNTKTWSITGIFLALVCGLNGVTSAILAPSYLIYWFFSRSRTHLLISLALGAGLLIQSYIIFTGTHSSREFTTSIELLTLPSALHSILGFWLTPFIVQAIGGVSLEFYNFLSIISVSALIVCLLIYFCRTEDRLLAACIILLGFAVSIFQTFGSLGNPHDLLGGPANGGRYYFVSLCAVLCALMIGSINNRLILIIFSVALASHAVSSYSPVWSLFTTGPDWKAAVQNCKDDICNLPVWPNGVKDAVLMRK